VCDCFGNCTVRCEAGLATVAAVHRSFEFGIGAMAGLSPEEGSLDVPTVTK
jgi:hypothetical protein